MSSACILKHGAIKDVTPFEIEKKLLKAEFGQSIIKNNLNILWLVNLYFL